MNAQQKLAIAAAEAAAKAIGAEVRAKHARMWAHPYPQYIFHMKMAEATPAWRWLARMHHRRQARRAKAMWEARADADACRAQENGCVPETTIAGCS